MGSLSPLSLKGIVSAMLCKQLPPDISELHAKQLLQWGVGGAVEWQWNYGRWLETPLQAQDTQEPPTPIVYSSFPIFQATEILFLYYFL